MMEWNMEGPKGNNSVTIFHLMGRLDASGCDCLFPALEYHIENGHSNFVINCYDLEFISSMGLGMLMRVHARMKKSGGNVKLARVHGATAKLLSLVMLDKVFRIYPTVHEAVDSFDDDGMTV